MTFTSFSWTLVFLLLATSLHHRSGVALGHLHHGGDDHDSHHKDGGDDGADHSDEWGDSELALRLRFQDAHTFDPVPGVPVIGFVQLFFSGETDSSGVFDVLNSAKAISDAYVNAFKDGYFKLEQTYGIHELKEESVVNITLLPMMPLWVEN